MALRSINKERRLYVLGEAGGGYSCLGFDILEGRLSRLLAWLQSAGVPLPCIDPDNAPKAGTPERYALYEATLEAARQWRNETGQRVETELTPQLCGLEGYRVEVDGYEEGTRRRFIVGKSTGWLPIHLEIARRDSPGGIGAARSYGGLTIIGKVR